MNDTNVDQNITADNDFWVKI